MSAKTLVELFKDVRGSSTKGDRVDGPLPVDVSGIVTTLEDVQLRQVTRVNSTGSDIESTITKQSAEPSIGRIYPHVFDAEDASGQARIYVVKALDDARSALESYGEADLEAVGSRLALIAATMGTCHSFTSFNESMGAVVSFVRRATLAMPSGEVTRPQLNALVHALHSLAANPMVDLDEATDIVDKLEGEGWRGQNGVADALISALLDEVREADEHAQAEFFPEHRQEE